ncbi:MAG: hypothetical protein H0V82_06295 [Candidatus Protochlamydia sp.]|nr:hypothetical protein [Candidatus Protochlamydia sp.]
MGGKTVSARLNEKTVWELEFLKTSMGDKKATDIIAEDIHCLYEFQNKKQQKKNPFDFLKEAGFIGTVEGEESDSLDYKKSVTARVKGKL